MTHLHSPLLTLARFVERVVLRTLGVGLGAVLVFMGLAMGVTIVMLPIGVPLGLAGVLLILLALTMPAEA